MYALSTPRKVRIFSVIFASKSTRTPVPSATTSSVCTWRKSLSIVVDEQLPQFVCEKCRTTVIEIYDYLRQVQVNQEQLLEQRRGYHIEPMENIQVEALADLDSFDRTEKNELGLEMKPKRMVPQVECNSVSISFENECKQETMNNELKPRRHKQRQGKRATIGRLEHSKDEPLAKRQENDKRIKEFFNLECEVCSAPLEDFTQLLQHYRQVHETKGYVRCCDKQYFRRYLLLDHILAHRGTIRCEICQKSYKSRRSLALHMVKMHSPEEHRPFKCDKCHVSFPKQYLLRAHELLHIQKQCRICQKVLSNNQSLKVHIAKIHGDDGNHICATCGELFRTKPAMERHIKAHLGLELVERLQCEYCKKWFNGKYNLRKHIRFLHNEEGQVFRCEICQHVSPNSRALSNHKQRIHVEEKFECEYCGKRFKHRPNLREHIASHTGNPLYSCEICGVTFNSKANYFTHRKNKHPVEWAAQKRIRSIREMSKN
uniref:C2H2-type domain-containing protein n=1 Tax=Anopheles atroparvus TaxID=41427 RepID=A0A182IZG6_ANOAO